MTNRFKIIDAICDLNIKTLTGLLDDNRTYQDASKELFLLKVGELFEIFKKAGDTKLLTFEGTCCSGECTNLGRGGFSFVGNTSKKYLNLIIEATANEIIDIYYCSDFLRNEDIDVKGELTINIRSDEKATFKPSIHYLITSEKCSSAIEEIKNSKTHAISKADYQYWLEKHAELFNSFELPPAYYRKYIDFFNLYSSIRSFFNWIPYEKALEEAVVSFKTLDITNENLLIQWLVKHEQLWDKVIGWSYNTEHDIIHNSVLVDKQHNLFIAAYDCSPVEEFLQTFESNYWPLLEKYRITLEKDFNGKTISSKAYREDHSLTYHLKLQGRI